MTLSIEKIARKLKMDFFHNSNILKKFATEISINFFRFSNDTRTHR